MFHKTIFLIMVLGATFMMLRNPESASKRNMMLISISLIAIIMTHKERIEKFEEDTTAVANKEETGEEEETKPVSDKPSEEAKSKEVQNSEKPKVTSSVTRLVTSQSATKDFTEFEDIFPKTFEDKDLIYYTSTFDAKNVAESNSLYNMKQSYGDPEENVLQIPSDSKSNINQRDGLYINFKQPMSTVYPREINFSTQEFTIIWYGKFVAAKRNTDVTKQNVYLINIPVHDSTNIVGVEFEFRDQYVNPTIKLHWKGKELENGAYKFESTSSDSDKSKNFFDNRYHMFTLIKTKDNEIKLILDDQTRTSEPIINTIIKSEENPVINEKNSYKITLNSNVDNPTSIDDVTAAKAPNASLNMYLCAIGIFNKAIDYADISTAYKYFTDVRYRLDPRTMEIRDEIDKLKTDSTCPFSDKSLCKTPNCVSADWKDNGSILANDKCVKDVAQYCASIDSYANDKLCTFFDSDNAKKMSSILEPEVKSDEKKETGSGEEEDDLVKQLRKIGINNIHLDKSLRANGKYSDEINQLIDKIYEQKQLNLKGLSTLEEVKDLNHSPLRYNDLLKEKSDVNGVISEAKAEKPLPKKNPKSELINLKYSDMEDYDDLMKEYNNEKSEKTAESPKPSLFNKLFS